MVKTESDTVTGNGKDTVPPEGLAMGIVDGLEGLTRSPESRPPSRSVRVRR